MSDKHVSQTVFSYLFCFSYILSIFILNISNSQFIVSIGGYSNDISNVKLVIYIFSLILFLLFYRFNKFTILDFILISLYLVSYYYHRMSIVFLVYFIFIKNVKFEYIVKSYIFAVLLGFTFVFFTYLFDLYPESLVDMYRTDGTYRNPLGYKFATYLPNMSLYVYLCWFFLRGKQFNIGDMLFIFILNFIIYFYTDTRTVFYLVNLFLFCAFLVKYKQVTYKTFILGRLASFITQYLFIILAGISIYLQCTYDPNIEWMDKLNKALSGRLYYGNKGFIEYGISLFGQKVEYADVLDFGESLFVIDSGFMKILIDYGLILFMAILYGYWVTSKKIVRKNNIYFGMVLVFSLLDVLINPHLLVMDSNPFFFFIAYYGANKDVNLFEIKNHENSLS